MSIQPVLLLTFSNNQDDYLSKIVAEQKAIKQALLDYVDKNYLEVRDVQHASTEEIFYLVNRYHQRLFIFHYGGHANQDSLQLEQDVGVVQIANVRGIDCRLVRCSATIEISFPERLCYYRSGQNPAG